MMTILTTERLALVDLPADVLETRLSRSDFTETVPIAGELVPVFFPEAWPGDALPVLPVIIAGRRENPDAVPRGGTVIERAERVAIGMLGCKGEPDVTGTVEFGYGLIPTHWNRGYGTEIVRAFVAYLLAQPDIRRVTAETLPDGYGSMRVLEKNGFTRTGTRVDAEDGLVVIWERLP